MRLELVSASPERLCVAGRGRPAAPFLLAPMFFILACLPWVAPTPVDTLRLLVSCACAGVACIAAICTWPRVYRLRLERPLPRAGALPSLALAEPSHWRLDAETEPDSPHVLYSASLDVDEGDRWLVLRHRHPEVLLRQLQQVLRHWPGRVECGWGLPDAARPWSFDPRLPPPAALAAGAEPALIVAPVAGTPLLWVMAVITVLMLVDLVFLVTSSKKALPFIHPLSVVLPAALGIALVTLSVGLTTAKGRLRVAARVLAESCVFGVSKPQGDVRLGSVRGVHLLGSPTAERWHVLIDSAEGPLALPVPRHQARVVAEKTEQAIAGARSAADDAARDR